MDSDFESEDAFQGTQAGVERVKSPKSALKFRAQSEGFMVSDGSLQKGKGSDGSTTLVSGSSDSAHISDTEYAEDSVDEVASVGSSSIQVVEYTSDASSSSNPLKLQPKIRTLNNNVSNFITPPPPPSSSKKENKSRGTIPKMKRYVIPDDEVVEFEGIEILNEDAYADGNAGMDDLPCRTLNNFVVFDLEDSCNVVSLDDIGLSDTDITISGDVEPLRLRDLDDEDISDDEDNSNNDDFDSINGSRSTSDPYSNTSPTQRVRLSAIFNYETNLTKNGTTEIWVRTCFAWYKLLKPDPRYAYMYVPIYKIPYIAHQAILHAEENPNLTVSQFINNLSERPDEVLMQYSPVTPTDLRDYRSNIMEEINISVEAFDKLSVLDSPLIKRLLKIKESRSGAKKKTHESAFSRGVRSTTNTITIGEPKHENPACITPLVASIARGLYARHLLNIAYFEAKPSVANSVTHNDAEADGQAQDSSEQSNGDPADRSLPKRVLSGMAQYPDDPDQWRKRYTNSKRTKLSGEKSVKGKISISELQSHASIYPLDVDDVYWPSRAKLRGEESDRRYFAEAIVTTPTDRVNLRIGDTVLVTAAPPVSGQNILPLWEPHKDKDYSKGSSESYARVVQIVSMYRLTTTGANYFHGRLLLPGRDTLLGEVAMPFEWFLVDACQSYSFELHMFAKFDIKFIPTKENIEASEWETNKTSFCRFWYDQTSGSFHDVNLHTNMNESIPMWCLSCTRRYNAATKRNSAVTLTNAIFGVNDRMGEPDDSSQVQVNQIPTALHNGVEYHARDFVYFPTEFSDQPFHIGYILKFIKKYTGKVTGNIVAEVRVLKRMRTLLVTSERPDDSTAWFNDERHLFWTTIKKDVPVSSLIGKCWVVHPDELNTSLNVYKDSDNNAFYAKYEAIKTFPRSPDDWRLLHPTGTVIRKEDGSAVDDVLLNIFPVSCPICKHSRNRQTSLLAQYLTNPISDNGTGIACGRHPLRAMDLFSGCGGLTQGIDQSGVVKTCWAVEYMPSAGITFAKNRPDVQVYNQCSNLLLDSAIKTYQGATVSPLINKFDGAELPPMPQPGDVDFIYCGPPCQGFSRCNRFIKADDIKTSLIANALSYVDFYRPSYFLLENVRGLLDYRLGGTQVGPGKVEGGIKMGMLKFILRTLTTMGYQARFYLLQAGNYGLAQSRRRLFVWASKRGCTLPGVPDPKTTFGKSGQTSIKFPDGTVYSPFAHLNGNAPHHAVTVKDALSDLPKFEYVNPAVLYPEPQFFKRDPKAAQYIAVNNEPTNIPGDLDGSRGFVGHMRMSYTGPPESEFQRLRRRKVQVVIPGIDCNNDALIDTLSNHVSRKFNAMNAERICNIPIVPGADHHDLPEKLRPWCLSAKESAASRHGGWKGLYGRLDPNGFFGTALTEMSPMGKSGTVIVPDQRRVLSVRECARAQGFPDKFVFYSIKPNDIRDMHRQVGNAVPPPLAYALSCKLREALFADYMDHIVPTLPDGIVEYTDEDISMADCSVDIYNSAPKRMKHM